MNYAVDRITNCIESMKGLPLSTVYEEGFMQDTGMGLRHNYAGNTADAAEQVLAWAREQDCDVLKTIASDAYSIR